MTFRDALADAEVRVWWAPLELPPERLAALRQTLADDEIERARRFRFERHRRRFVASRGLLRQILARHTARSPADLRFTYGPKGKPALAGEAESGLSFNVSHSHEVALFALARGRPVGVDVEHLRAMPDARELAQRFFSAVEAEALDRVGPDRRDRAFFQGWTRKEAYVKAIGDGLSMALDRFAVTLAPGEPARFLDLDGAELAAAWTLHHLEPTPGYVGALAYEGPARRLSVARLST